MCFATDGIFNAFFKAALIAAVLFLGTPILPLSSASASDSMYCDKAAEVPEQATRLLRALCREKDEQEDRIVRPPNKLEGKTYDFGSGGCSGGPGGCVE